MSLNISSACRFCSESTLAVIVVVMRFAFLCVRYAHNHTKFGFIWSMGSSESFRVIRFGADAAKVDFPTPSEP